MLSAENTARVGKKIDGGERILTSSHVDVHAKPDRFELKSSSL